VITAVAAARLGVRTRVMSGVGPAAVTRLRAERVAVTNLKRPDEAHAISAALSTATDRSFVTFNGVNDVLEPRLLGARAALRARHVHFAFYPRRCGRWLPVLAALRAAGATTSWDFGWNEGLLGDARFPALLGALDYVFVNELEAPLYARQPSLDAALAAWRRAPHHTIVKLGASGSRWLARDRDLHAAAPRVRAVDTTGAGDAFNGGFLCGLLRGLPPAACLRLGNVVGAMSTRRAGGLDGLPSASRLPAALRAATTA
jgi:sugar/nucleoside kinase (ribokinase family)